MSIRAAAPFMMVGAMVLGWPPDASDHVRAQGPANAPPQNPRLIVLNKEESALAIVDPMTRKVLGRVPTGEAPHEVAASNDGKLAFVANYGSAQSPGRTISVIDLAAQKPIHTVDLGPLRRPHGIYFADGRVYFTAEANRLVARFDPANDHFDWAMGTGQTGTHMILVSKDTRKVITANIGSDSVMMFERGSNPASWDATVVTVGKGPEGIDLSPDEREIWTAHSRDGGVSIIDVAAKKVVGTLQLHTKRSNRLKFTPDGKRVLVSDLEGGEIVVIDVPSRKEIKRLALGRSPEGILISPEGARAYVAVNGDDAVAIVDLGTLAETGRIQTGRGPDGMAWAAAQ